MKEKEAKENRGQRIMSLLRCAQASVKCRIVDKARGLGFSMPQFMALTELYRNDNITMHELSEKLNLPKSSVSRMVDQLVKRSLVKRVRPLNNRRTVRLTATSSFRKGKIKIIDMVSGEINRKVSAREAEKIIAALETLCGIVKYEKNTNCQRGEKNG